MTASLTDLTIADARAALKDRSISARELAQAGVTTGATGRNRLGFSQGVRLPAELPEWQHNMLYDPQTAGPLLVACSPDAAQEVLALFHARGFDAAAIIGHCAAHGAGDPDIVVS